MEARKSDEMMRQDRFTEQAQEVLQTSQEMVRTHSHAQWDVEHVLLAALSHKEGLARRIFQALNVPVENLIERVARNLGQRPKAQGATIQLYASSVVFRRLIIRLKPIAWSVGGSSTAIVSTAMSAVRAARGIAKRRNRLTPETTAAAVRTDPQNAIWADRLTCRPCRRATSAIRTAAKAHRP